MAETRKASNLTELLKNGKFGDWFGISEKGTFAAFLLLATIVWLLGALSKEYTLEIPVAIEYKNLPSDKVATAPLVNELFVTVKGEGRSLIRKNRDARKNGVTLDLSKSPSSRIAVTSLIPQIAEQFSGLVISGIQPDSLVLKFAEALTKKVPVVAKHDLTFASQYDLRAIALSPDSVAITGPLNEVQAIETWSSETIDYENLNNSQTGKIALKDSEIMGLRIEPMELEYEVQVDQYTEKVVEVEIKAVNLPEDKKVILYPNQAKLTFQLTVDDYEVFDAGFFEVEADFQGKINSDANQIPLKLVTQPLEARNARLEPKFVEFIIYK